ncbi:hypothetical protein NS274_18960 [Pseudomonas oryzihabitans]|nr:hypothetical protein NS274_18960 [Pseudomonas psychrotolerans]KTT40036.1 hypothetical protein SB5_09505 [Pseudomonas psychrotolerans]KTT43784.1 hypothetical protein RSA46_14815 [Pseudomonas psychrotolerans]
MKQEELIAEGDRVDHKIFGLGTVVEAEFKGFSSSNTSPGNGYPVTVKWDDPERRDSSVMHWALTKVSSPDVRPYKYWDKQYQPLRQNWLSARRRVEQLSVSFEVGWAELDPAIDAEEEAWVKMREFINTPRS